MCFWGWAQITETSRITQLNQKKENDLLEQRCEIFEKLLATRKLRKLFLSWYDHATRERSTPDAHLGAQSHDRADSILSV